MMSPKIIIKILRQMAKSQLDLYLEEMQQFSTKEASGLASSMSDSHDLNSKQRSRERKNYRIISHFVKSIRFTTDYIIVPAYLFLLETICLGLRANLEWVLDRWKDQSQSLISFLAGSLESSTFAEFQKLLISKVDRHNNILTFGSLFIVSCISIVLIAIWISTHEIILLLTVLILIVSVSIPYISSVLLTYTTRQLVRQCQKASIHSLTILNLLKSVQQASLSINVSHPVPPIFALEKTLDQLHGTNVVFECESARKSLQYSFYTFQRELLSLEQAVSSYTQFFAPENDSLSGMEQCRSLLFKTIKPVTLESFPSSSILQQGYGSIMKGLLPITVARIVSLPFNGAVTRPLTFKQMEDVHFSIYRYMNNRPYLRWLSCIYEGNITFFCHNRHCCLLVQLIASVWLLCLSVAWLLECLTVVRRYNLSVDQIDIPYQDSDALSVPDGITNCSSDRNYNSNASDLTTSLSGCYFDTRVKLLKSRRKYEQILLKLWLCEKALTDADLVSTVCSASVASNLDSGEVKVTNSLQSLQEKFAKLQKVVALLSGQQPGSPSLLPMVDINNGVSCVDEASVAIKNHLHNLVTAAETNLSEFHESLDTLCFQFHQLACGASVTNMLADLRARATRATTSSQQPISESNTASINDLHPSSSPNSYPFPQHEQSLLEFLATRASDGTNGTNDETLRPVFKDVQDYLRHLDMAYKDEQGRRLVDVFVGTVPEAVDPTASDAVRKQRQLQRNAGRYVEEESAEEKIMRELRVRITARSETAVERECGDIKAMTVNNEMKSVTVTTGLNEQECDINQRKSTKSVMPISSPSNSNSCDDKGAVESKEDGQVQSPSPAAHVEEEISKLVSCAATVDLARTFKSTIEQFRSAHEVSLGDSSDDDDDKIKVEEE